MFVAAQIDVEIINDNQWEPDEEFFLKISLLMDPEKREGVQLGRISIMEITILNDDGEICLLIGYKGCVVTHLDCMVLNGDGEMKCTY